MRRGDLGGAVLVAPCPLGTLCFSGDRDAGMRGGVCGDAVDGGGMRCAEVRYA
jgi:hypothetical protein